MQPTKVDAKVGPVMIDNVKITNMGRGFGRGGFGPKGMQPSEGVDDAALRLRRQQSRRGLGSHLHARVLRQGRQADRPRHQEAELGGEGGGLELDHPILEYVLPMVSDVEDLDDRPPRLTRSVMRAVLPARRLAFVLGVLARQAGAQPLFTSAFPPEEFARAGPA